MQNKAPMAATRQPAWMIYALFFTLTAAAASVGALFGPGAWYAALQKPSFNPPNWLFAPVWTVLYVMIAVAGARTWRVAADSGVCALWGLQLALNAVWTYLFFGVHRADLALIDIGLLLATIVAFIVRAWPIDRTSAGLFVPYFLWVSFATALNFALWR